jgi:hypothetical protein
MIRFVIAENSAIVLSAWQFLAPLSSRRSPGLTAIEPQLGSKLGSALQARIGGREGVLISVDCLALALTGTLVSSQA